MHQSFSPNKDIWRYLPLATLRLRALNRSRKGIFDETTEALFRGIWARSRAAGDLIWLLRYEREMGTVVPDECREGLRELCRSARGNALWRAALFALEAGEEDMLSDRLDDLAQLGRPSPPIADYLVRAGVAVGPAHASVAHLHVKQEAWRADFATWLRRRSGSTCVVGNAAHLRGMGLGSRIDANKCVVRFNAFGIKNGAGYDLGERLQVWVCTYDYLERSKRLERPPPEWMILSGADVRYRWRTWRMVDKALEQGLKVLTIPDAIWVPVVRRLRAPPSAGVLTLAWFAHLLGGFDAINAAGFQRLQPAQSRRYHYRSPLRTPGRRHDWPAERALLAEWALDGLNFIDLD